MSKMTDKEFLKRRDYLIRMLGDEQRRNPEAVFQACLHVVALMSLANGVEHPITVLRSLHTFYLASMPKQD